MKTKKRKRLKAIDKMVDEARRRTGLGFILLARRLTAEGLPVSSRVLFRWACGEGPHPRSMPAVREALQRIIDAG